MEREILEYWPVFVAVVCLIIAFAKAFNRIEVLEEKVKTLFSLWNDKK
tara:strand:- start:9700 stop:9843 length:144 start_codon:yes stop_codon:yes gene_type:complete